MGSKPIPDFAAAMGRIRSVTGCATQQELAALFGVRQSTISAAGKRRAIPAEWLLVLLRETGANPGWVLTGCGTRTLSPADSTETKEPPAPQIGAERLVENCTAQELVDELVRRALRQQPSGRG